MWQDYTIAAIVYMFVAVTIPQVIDVVKGRTSLNIITAGPTFLGNYKPIRGKIRSDDNNVLIKRFSVVCGVARCEHNDDGDGI